MERLSAAPWGVVSVLDWQLLFQNGSGKRVFIPRFFSVLWANAVESGSICRIVAADTKEISPYCGICQQGRDHRVGDSVGRCGISGNDYLAYGDWRRCDYDRCFDSGDRS